MGEQMRYLVVLIFTILSSSRLFAADTELKLYHPFNNDQASLHIKEKIAGQCWQQSQQLKREEAWRCMAGTKVYDPCFIKAFGASQQALCPQSPWSDDTVEIELAASHDNSEHLMLDMSKAYPWALELVTGEKCRAVDEGGEIDRLPIRYHCDNDSVLLGHIQRCDPSWRILQRSSQGVEAALISRAWF